MALSVSPPHASLAPYEEVLLTLHFAPVRLDETTGFKSTAKAAVEYEEFSANVLIEASTEQVGRWMPSIMRVPQRHMAQSVPHGACVSAEPHQRGSVCFCSGCASHSVRPQWNQSSVRTVRYD